ncbi:hypothetical protein IKA92_01980 [bacterium]|nr:hypothetical protein [bacterium]
MQNDEFLEETREIPEVRQEVEFVFNFFKCGLRVEIIEAKSDSDAFAELRKRGYLVGFLDAYVRYNKVDQTYEVFKMK